MRTDCKQYLNAADRLMLVAHEGMQGIGHPGFICQTHVRLKGRVDVAKLRGAFEELTRRYPVMTARLKRDDHGMPYWEGTDEPSVLHEIQVGSGDNVTDWKVGERLFDKPLDLGRETPISFHLLHGPDGRDTLILRFTHVLMDGKAPEWALQLIDDCFEARAEGPSVAHSGVEGQASDDEMEAHLKRFDRMQRLRSALRVIGSQIRLPVTSVTMAPPDQKGWLVGPVGLMARTLDEPVAAAVTHRVKRVCGFPNLAPAVLASTFRAISRCTPHRTTGQTWYQTDCPLNLRPPGVREPVFRNFMTFIQLSLRQDELADRDEATRLLSAQMRDQIRRGIDLGNLQMMAVMSRFAPLLRSHLIARMKRQPVTLGFGYLGPVAQELSRFCRRDVENVYTFNASLSPPGVTLQANQFAGRINLLLTFITSAVPEALANRLLDEIIADLCE